MSDRQKLFYALLVSAFFHLALGMVLAIWTTQHSAEVAKALPDLTQLTVTIMPPRPASPAAAKAAKPPLTILPPPPSQMMRPDLDSDGLKTSSKAPANAVFQSDANMVAGSQLPATGNIPLPSLGGPKRKFVDFADRAASSGKGQTAAEANPALASAPIAPGRPTTATSQARNPPAQSIPAPTAAARIAEATPTQRPTPAPTAAPDTLALGKATPTPPPPSQLPTPVEQLARLTVPPSLRGNADMAPMTRPPSPSERLPEPSTQREMEKTHIDGGITAPGAPGVDAVETPFGRYHRKLSNLIGSRWKLYLQEHPKDVGDVTILVKINTDGKVAGTRVVANHSLDDLAELSTRAIMESDLPPVPDDLAPMLREGKLEISFNFNVYDASNDLPGR